MGKIGKKKLCHEWLLEWLEEKRNYVKKSTYANYSNIIHNHLIPEIGNYYLCDINNKMLQQLILEKYHTGRVDNNGGLSDKTIRDIGTVIKLSFKSAIKDNIIEYINLDFNYPKNAINTKIHFFSKMEQRKIIEYCLNNLSIKSVCLLLSLYQSLLC